MFNKAIARSYLAISILTFAVTAQAIDIDLVTVGNPGNANDATGYGKVTNTYNIGKYEITNAQWRGFLAAKAALGDPYGLYDSNMAGTYGGIVRTGAGTVGNPYVYSAKGGNTNWDNRPVNYVSFWDAARFCNWLHNGQGAGSTETGAYINIGNQYAFARQSGAKYFIPTENEWYKAAYHKNDGVTGNYFDYPTSSNSTPGNAILTPDSGNNANIKKTNYTIGSPFYTTLVGEFENSKSPYGTFDQGGNLWEWTETPINGSERHQRGGDWNNDLVYNFTSAHADRYGLDPTEADYGIGFRVAAVYVPEPSSIAMLSIGGLCLIWRWTRGRSQSKLS
jgi:formylglycine-generating enzyme